jgi:hypothetical protein
MIAAKIPYHLRGYGAVYFSGSDATKVLLISQNNGEPQHIKQAAGTLLESPALLLKRKDLPTLIFVCR